MNKSLLLSIFAVLSNSALAQLVPVPTNAISTSFGLTQRVNKGSVEFQVISDNNLNSANNTVMHLTTTTTTVSTTTSTKGVSKTTTKTTSSTKSVSAAPIYDQKETGLSPVTTAVVNLTSASTNSAPVTTTSGSTTTTTTVTEKVNQSESGGIPNQYLQLRVLDGGDGNAFDHADWANAKVSCTDGDHYLSDLTSRLVPTATRNGWGPFETDSSNGEYLAGDGHPIFLRGTMYKKGLGVHATSVLIFDLKGMGCTTFTSDIGVDDEVAGYVKPDPNLLTTSQLGQTNIGTGFDSTTGSGWLTETGDSLSKNDLLLAEARLRRAVINDGSPDGIVVENQGADVLRHERLLTDAFLRSIVDPKSVNYEQWTFVNSYANVKDAGIIFVHILPGSAGNNFSITITNPPTLTSTFLQSMPGVSLAQALLQAISGNDFKFSSQMSVSCDPVANAIVIKNPTYIRGQVVDAVNNPTIINATSSASCPVKAVDADFVYGYMPMPHTIKTANGIDNSSFDNLGFIAAANMPIRAKDISSPNPNTSFEYNALLQLQNDKSYTFGGIQPYIYYGGMKFISNSSDPNSYAKENGKYSIRFVSDQDRSTKLAPDAVSVDCSQSPLVTVTLSSTYSTMPDSLRIVLANTMNSDHTCPMRAVILPSWNSDPAVTKSPIVLNGGVSLTNVLDGEDYNPIYQQTFSAPADSTAIANGQISVLAGDPYFVNSKYQFQVASKLSDLNTSKATLLFMQPMKLDGSGVRDDFTKAVQSALANNGVNGTFVSTTTPDDFTLMSKFCAVKPNSTIITKINGKALTNGTVDCSIALPSPCIIKKTNVASNSSSIYDCSMAATHFTGSGATVVGTLFLQSGPSAVNNKISQVVISPSCSDPSTRVYDPATNSCKLLFDGKHIATTKDFQTVLNNIALNNGLDSSGNPITYTLMQDIDASSLTNFSGIGVFSGILDGAGHRIKGLKLNVSNNCSDLSGNTYTCMALISELDNGTVKNLIIESPMIDTSSNPGTYAATVVGIMNGSSSSLSNVTVSDLNLNLVGTADGSVPAPNGAGVVAIVNSGSLDHVSLISTASGPNSFPLPLIRGDGSSSFAGIFIDTNDDLNQPGPQLNSLRVAGDGTNHLVFDNFSDAAGIGSIVSGGLPADASGETFTNLSVENLDTTNIFGTSVGIIKNINDNSVSNASVKNFLAQGNGRAAGAFYGIFVGQFPVSIDSVSVDGFSSKMRRQSNGFANQIAGLSSTTRASITNSSVSNSNLIGNMGGANQINPMSLFLGRADAFATISNNRVSNSSLTNQSTVAVSGGLFGSIGRVNQDMIYSQMSIDMSPAGLSATFPRYRSVLISNNTIDSLSTINGSLYPYDYTNMTSNNFGSTGRLIGFISDGVVNDTNLGFPGPVGPIDDLSLAVTHPIQYLNCSTALNGMDGQIGFDSYQQKFKTCVSSNDIRLNLTGNVDSNYISIVPDTFGSPLIKITGKKIDPTTSNLTPGTYVQTEFGSAFSGEVPAPIYSILISDFNGNMIGTSASQAFTPGMSVPVPSSLVNFSYSEITSLINYASNYGSINIQNVAPMPSELIAFTDGINVPSFIRNNYSYNLVADYGLKCNNGTQYNSADSSCDIPVLAATSSGASNGLFGIPSGDGSSGTYTMTDSSGNLVSNFVGFNQLVTLTFSPLDPNSFYSWNLPNCGVNQPCTVSANTLLGTPATVTISCNSAYHNESGTSLCIANTRSCMSSDMGAKSAIQNWDFNNNMWGACLDTGCSSNYTLVGTSCQAIQCSATNPGTVNVTNVVAYSGSLVSGCQVSTCATGFKPSTDLLSCVTSQVPYVATTLLQGGSSSTSHTGASYLSDMPIVANMDQLLVPMDFLTAISSSTPVALTGATVLQNLPIISSNGSVSLGTGIPVSLFLNREIGGTNYSNVQNKANIIRPSAFTIDQASNLYGTYKSKNAKFQDYTIFQISGQYTTSTKGIVCDGPTNCWLDLSNSTVNTMNPNFIIFFNYYTSNSLVAPLFSDLEFDASGNLFVSDTNNNIVLKVTNYNTDPTKAPIFYPLTISQVSFTVENHQNLPTTFSKPTGLRFDSSGNLYVVNQTGNPNDPTKGFITKIDMSSNLASFGADPTYLFSTPTRLAFDSQWNMFVVESGLLSTVDMIGADNKVTTLTTNIPDGSKTRFSHITIGPSDELFLTDLDSANITMLVHP